MALMGASHFCFKVKEVLTIFLDFVYLLVCLFSYCGNIWFVLKFVNVSISYWSLYLKYFVLMRYIYIYRNNVTWLLKHTLLW